MRDVPGSRDHLRMGSFYHYGWGDFAAAVNITASDGTPLTATWAFLVEEQLRPLSFVTVLENHPATLALIRIFC
jgi:hypothetical protein